ncbi:extracellular antigen protein, similar to Lysteria LemA protein [Sulfurovum sp. enrichment culture clone C5]|uniref:Extracellular antigen protein, similar to Lysteria LemA protein n=1 Tax=Sulfurovum sp. enrichment culture clone C5 TaxID=497650 RepID=A0A0S4XPC9_9BACT|nr:extracellular antigen protein, similar to Lysteria LemA protein [Sulfurovum sp. enrichment culture clone C5]
MKIVGIIGAILLLLAAIIILPKVNNVPRLDENVNMYASQLDNQYKRRSDLIPNLVATVKGYASHEKDVLTQVTEARAKVGQMTLTPEVLNNPEAFKAYQNAQDGLSSALSRLMMVTENYPELKANENFLQLQAQLEGTENRIAVARKDYIESVKEYNLELRTVPGKWVAALLYPEAEVKQNFTATTTESATPKVAF